MTRILTFLGYAPRDCAVASVAMAKQLAEQGRRVLWVTQDNGPLPEALWQQTISGKPTALTPGLGLMRLSGTALLSLNWDIVKSFEAQYLRDPLLKQVYSQELVLLPGMDQALTLNALRELDASGEYDDIVFDGPEGQTALRMWGLPDGLDWYVRRFQAIIQASALAQTLSPFWQPIAGAIFASGRGQDSWSEPMAQSRGFLAAGRAAVQDPGRVLGFLVAHPQEVAATRYLWGCSQQVGLTIGAVLDLFADSDSTPEDAFDPLKIYPIPGLREDNWSSLMAALPDVDQVIKVAPRSLTIDAANNQVRLFLPGFDKSQIGLTQSGPEVTIDAGNQRRNLYLPEPFKNRTVQGAKFQENALILSF